MDVLSASGFDHKIVWYENDGSQNFTAHTITTSAIGGFSVFAADVDSDGDMDVLSASHGDHKVAWYENKGGHFAFTTADTGPAEIESGESDDVLKIVVTHRGRAGDIDVELATLDFLFEESPGNPLTSVQANAIIENLHIYLDDNSGQFEMGSDTLITSVDTFALTDGIQTVSFSDGNPNVQIAFGVPKTYFVVVELTGNAASQSPEPFHLTHLTESSTGENPEDDTSLVVEFAPDVSTSIQPAVVEVVDLLINNGQDQRSTLETVTVVFNQDMNLADLIASSQIGNAVIITELTTGSAVNIDPSRFSYDFDLTSGLGTLAIDLDNSLGTGGILSDGQYQLTLTSLIHAVGDEANTLATITTKPFHQMRGDFNGDKRRDIADRAQLLASFGATLGEDNDHFDLDGNKTINVFDYIKFLFG